MVMVWDDCEGGWRGGVRVWARVMRVRAMVCVRVIVIVRVLVIVG
jgi:hypothetical protein